MKLLPLNAFADNYLWLLHDGKNALVVDPGDAKPVFNALTHEQSQLQTILVTHHHSDHTGGIDALRDATGAQVVGPAHETIPGPLRKLQGGDTVAALGLQFEVMYVPGHTAGHIAYYCADVDGTPLLFCGDTLFSAGCGRLFEGSPAQMLRSLQSLAALPGNTRVCCTHEYTLSNLKFAREVDPHNIALQDYQTQCLALRAQNLPTLPSTIALERSINPFLRSDQAALAASASRFDAAGVAQHGVFATLRQWKNQYP
jgi:hydroxyacylglutathione hydrolase